MRTTFASSALAVSALMIASPAAAQGYAFPIDIPAQSLSAALRDLARQTGSELLFDRSMLRGMQAQRLRSRLTVEAGLQQLLAGTGLVSRRATSGAWVIERARVAAPAAVAPPVAPAIDLPAPEILVTASLSQNADIRRRENDVQPYQVSTREEILSAHRDNLGQYFRSRATGDTHALPPGLLDAGATNSQIDLRGFGPAGTMILIDGRRMPGVPDINAGAAQPDINAIPLHAIERVETLTGTAGGIHGFGALGGVVNVILKRDYRGAELHATGGVSTRGDAERLALEGRVGFTPDDGRTDVMLALGWSTEAPLLVGQRNYTARSRQRTFDRLPEMALILDPRANGVLVTSSVGSDPLMLKPEYGGGVIEHDYAFLPPGFDGNPSGLYAALKQAGQPDFSLTLAEATSQMGANAETLSAIASLRHDFGGDVEGYVDGLFLRNRGRTQFHTAFGSISMSPDVPQNPFTNYVSVTFPAAPQDGQARTTFDNARVTAGVIVPLWRSWRGTAEASYGESRYESVTQTNPYVGPALLFGFGDDDPALTPFGNWGDFGRAIAGYRGDLRVGSSGRMRYEEQSLRLAGPLIETGRGAAVLTLAAQRRREEAPRYRALFTDKFPGFTLARSLAEESLYAEFRAPLFGDEAPVPLLKGLELQLTARHDRRRFFFVSDPYNPETSEVFDGHFSGTSVTAGAKISPVRWLILRASYATGLQPPTNFLIPVEMESSRAFLLDPKRGNDFFIDDGTYIERMDGNPDLEEIEAGTLSLGMVLNPLGDRAPRLSFDYSRIVTTGEPFIPSSVLEHEDIWPERVIREPLTEADRALGYTAGRILMIDSSAGNGGSSRIETLDALLDWRVPVLGGTLRTYGAATWQIGNTLTEPAAPAQQRVGFARSPVEWRANGGVDFTRGPLALGANLQYVGRYRPYQYDTAILAPDFIAVQGSAWVAAQVYLDLYASRRFRMAGTDASVALGIVNVFDQAPAFEADPYSATHGYSMYGDPRRRRVEAVLSAEF